MTFDGFSQELFFIASSELLAKQFYDPDAEEEDSRGGGDHSRGVGGWLIEGCGDADGSQVAQDGAGDSEDGGD